MPHTDLSPVALSPPPPVPLRSFHSHSCAKKKKKKSKFIISLSIFDRLSGRRSGSLKCRKAFPSLRSPASQQVCEVNLLPLSKLLSVLKGRERRQRGSERAIWDFFFFFFPPQMPGHAVSPTQRAFEISSLVNSCLMEARRGERLTDSERRTPKFTFVN